jgi:hypothetical protein
LSIAAGPIVDLSQFRSINRLLAVGFVLGLAGCASPPASPPPAIGSFGDFRPATARGHYLACPRNYCIATADEVTPLREISAAKLRDLVRRTLDAQPRTELLSASNEGLRLVYRQRGGMFGTAGTVTVEIVDADDGVSGVVLYAESDGGDTASARDRVRDWLDAIDSALGVRH